MPEPSANCPDEVRDYVEYTSLMINVSRHCNLDCRLCYVDKSIPFDELSDEAILDFIERYRVFVEENFDTGLNLHLCGHGELFCRPGFPSMIRRLADSPIRHICLTTNGSIDRLDELGSLEKVTFAVSLDLPKAFHEWNRGEGNFR
jgi:MoaA/NifB/PqqE/SkfB family radical SAM enzyme